MCQKKCGDDKPICPLCGGELCWDNTEMAEDIFDEYSGDEIAQVNFFTCLQCGRSLEVIDPTEEDRDKLPFWDNAN